MAESRKIEAEPSALAVWLESAWRTLNSNSPTATVVWAAILAGLVFSIGYAWYSRASADTTAALWFKLQTETETEELRRLTADFPGKMPARIAEFQVARRKLADGLGLLAAPSAEERLRAADQVEAAAKTYARLADDPSTPLLLRQEALLQQAKAEETLASVPKADNSGPRGSLDAAQKLYERLAAQFAGTFQAKAAARRAGELRDRRKEIESLNAELAVVQSPPSAGPALPIAAPPEPPAPIVPPSVPDVPTPAPDPSPPSDPQPQ